MKSRRNQTNVFNVPIVLQPTNSTTAGIYTFQNSASTASSNALQFLGNISGGTTLQTITLTLTGTNATGNNLISGNISMSKDFSSFFAGLQIA